MLDLVAFFCLRFPRSFVDLEFPAKHWCKVLGFKVLTHPKLAVAVVGVPAASVALNVGRWFLGSMIGQASGGNVLMMK